MKRIIIHWTGGVYTPNDHEKNCYHFLVDGDGKVVKGIHKVEDNENVNDGNYAAHTGGGNTGSIGVALCGMHSIGYPIRRKQLEAMCKLVAELSIKYKIPIKNNTILTHSEFGHSHPDTTSFGKIDIDKLPCIALYNRVSCGNWIRNKVNWYRSKI